VGIFFGTEFCFGFQRRMRCCNIQSSASVRDKTTTIHSHLLDIQTDGAASEGNSESTKPSMKWELISFLLATDGKRAHAGSDSRQEASGALPGGGI
jgi:hypothetical protein